MIDDFARVIGITMLLLLVLIEAAALFGLVTMIQNERDEIADRRRRRFEDERRRADIKGYR